MCVLQINTHTQTNTNFSANVGVGVSCTLISHHLILTNLSPFTLFSLSCFVNISKSLLKWSQKKKNFIAIHFTRWCTQMLCMYVCMLYTMHLFTLRKGGQPKKTHIREHILYMPKNKNTHVKKWQHCYRVEKIQLISLFPTLSMIYYTHIYIYTYIYVYRLI